MRGYVLGIRSFISFGLIAVALIVSGCCGCAGEICGQLPDPEPYEYSSSLSADEQTLVGSWSSEGPSGTLFDPATGFVTGSYYSLEGYLFRSDGTYRYIIMGSGTIISGAAVNNGKFRVEGDNLILTERTEDWYPDPSSPGNKESYKNRPTTDEMHTIEFITDDELKIDGTSYLYRIKND